MLSKQQEWSVIQSLYRGIQNTSAMYTGNSLKELLRTQVFALKSEFRNHPINSGRWGAYCHYSPVAAFANLLDKHQIDQHSTLVVHSLLPPDLMNEVIRRGCKLIVADVDLATLIMDEGQLDVALESHPDLIIHYTSNGLYRELAEIVRLTNELKVPSLTIVDNELPTSDLLDLFEANDLGSVLWNFGDSFMDDQLNDLLEVSLQNSKWYVSWFIESRTRSSLEYHLSSSRELMLPLLENYLYLLLTDYAAHGWREKLYPVLFGFLAKEQITSREGAQQQLATHFQNIQRAAIPDIIFDIELLDPKGIRPSSLREIEDLEHYLHSLNQKFFESVVNQDGVTLYVQDFARTYLKSTIFTGSRLAWKQLLAARGYTAREINLHSDVLALKHRGVQVLMNQGLEVDFAEVMYKQAK